MQLEFTNWINTYSSIMKNVTGQDRVQALSSMPDDKRFDAWLTKFAETREKESQSMGRKSAGKGTAITQDEFLSRSKGQLPNPGR